MAVYAPAELGSIVRLSDRTKCLFDLQIFLSKFVCLLCVIIVYLQKKMDLSCNIEQ